MSSITLSALIEKFKTRGITSIFGSKVVSEQNLVEDDILLKRIRCVLDNTASD